MELAGSADSGKFGSADALIGRITINIADGKRVLKKILTALSLRSEAQ